MKIVVASKNPVKVRAVEAAFSSQFPDEQLEMLPLTVVSGVSEQPRGDAETRRGARNRARNAREQRPDANYWVGLEGGIDILDEQLFTFAWMCVTNGNRRMSEARSATLPLPPAVGDYLDAGLELGEANDRVFDTVNSKQGGGAYGLLTDGRYTREGIYTQTVILALIPFVHELYR